MNQAAGQAATRGTPGITKDHDPPRFAERSGIAKATWILRVIIRNRQSSFPIVRDEQKKKGPLARAAPLSFHRNDYATAASDP